MSRRQQPESESKPNAISLSKQTCGVTRATHLVLVRKETESIELYAAGEKIAVICFREMRGSYGKFDFYLDERIHVCREELPQIEKIKAGSRRRKELKARANHVA